MGKQSERGGFVEGVSRRETAPRAAHKKRRKAPRWKHPDGVGRLSLHPHAHAHEHDTLHQRIVFKKKRSNEDAVDAVFKAFVLYCILKKGFFNATCLFLQKNEPGALRRTPLSPSTNRR
jgi:hypothetical protein